MIIAHKVEAFPRRHVVVFLACLGSDLLAWVIILCMRVIFGGRLLWQNGLWCVFPREGVWCRRIAAGYAGGTLGHGGWLRAGEEGGEGIDTKTEFHEHVHVEQYEVVMIFVFLILSGWLVTAICTGVLSSHWPLIAGYYISGGFLGLASSWMIAFLRGESVYRGSTHEESAYAQEIDFRKHSL